MLLLILALASVALYWLFDRIARGKHPPELPIFYPVLGTIPYFLRGFSYDNVWDFIKPMLDSTLQIGGFGRTWFGYQTLYTVADPDAGIKILSECLEKDNVYKVGKPWLGESLFTADVQVWQTHRKLLNPAFKQCILEGFIDIFSRQSRRIVNMLSPEVEKGSINIFDHLAYISTRTIAMSIFSLTEERIDDLNNTFKEYLEAQDRYQIVIIKRMTRIWFHFDWVFNLMGGELKVEHDKLLKILHKTSNQIIESKKNQNKVEPPLYDNSKPFLDLSLDLTEQKYYTEEQLRAEVDLMLFAGHDTSATVLMYTLVLLGSYPETQEKLFKEIEEVLPNPDKDITKQDLARLVYTEAVLKESMRVYPPVPLLGRNVHKHMMFESCTLRAGNKCGVAVPSLHRHPVWGPDADQFRPERWLGGQPVCAGAYMPFSWGRRGCIGKAYAMISMKTTLAYLVRAYRFSADHTKMQFRYHLLMKPVSGHHVAIERRV